LTQLREICGAPQDYDALLERIGDARFVLLGEASHGTHEFYRERSRITRRLIAEKGFAAVAIEGDWPAAARVNRYVRGAGGDTSVAMALDGFERFPAWRWRNTDVLQFAGWLRRHNDALPQAARRAGFYGLDLYSLFDSIATVLRYLERADPAAARRARERYVCFDHFGQDSQRYGYATAFGMAKSCEAEVLAQLLEMHSRTGGHGVEPDERFHAEQNARLVRNAEEYYRTLFRGHVSSWNLRDSHMAEMLEALVGHLERRHPGPGGHAPVKVVVWAHNSHLGDARATELGQAGELNVGQLVRERYGREALLVGFSTYTGMVTAASDWGGPAERKHVRPALGGSWEELFHELAVPDLLLGTGGLEGRRVERAIGVVYRPETERISHYFHARLASQFDAVLHFDETSAVEPLERTSEWEVGELPETYPWGV
jgi:erythromycin esterase-like protein